MFPRWISMFHFFDHLLSKTGLSVYYEKAQVKFQELDSGKELSVQLQNNMQL